MKNILENVKLVGSMIVIGVVLFYIVTTVFIPELTIKIFKFQPYIVVTESMEPIINVNDVVVVTTFDIDEAEVGDIITFNADIDYNGVNEVVTHYIYEIDTNGEETIIRTHRYFDEDAEVSPDTWLIPASDVIGSYSFRIARLGLVLGFIKSIYGIAVIGLNIVLIIAIKHINKSSRESEEFESQKEEEPVEETIIESQKHIES